MNTERVFTRFIQKIPPLAEQQEHWEKFGTALSPIREGEEKLKFAYLDFAEWVESKIQKKPLRQIIEEKRRRIEKHG